MKINISISTEAHEHIFLLRVDQELYNAILVWGRFDFESYDYYNLAFVSEDQINDEWPYFEVGNLKVSIDKKEISDLIADKTLVILNKELSFE